MKKQDGLFDPFRKRKRAQQTKEIFEPFQTWTAKDFLKGYFEVLDNDDGIACTLAPGSSEERCVYKVEGATDYEIDNIYEHDTNYSFNLNGSRAFMLGLSAFFVSHGVKFPEYCDWHFEGVEIRPPRSAAGPAGVKRRGGQADPAEGGEAAGDGKNAKKAPPRSSTVAQALRERLASQGSPKEEADTEVATKRVRR